MLRLLYLQAFQLLQIQLAFVYSIQSSVQTWGTAGHQSKDPLWISDVENQTIMSDSVCCWTRINAELQTKSSDCHHLEDACLKHHHLVLAEGSCNKGQDVVLNQIPALILVDMVHRRAHHHQLLHLNISALMSSVWRPWSADGWMTRWVSVVPASCSSALRLCPSRLAEITACFAGLFVSLLKQKLVIQLFLNGAR